MALVSASSENTALISRAQLTRSNPSSPPLLAARPFTNASSARSMSLEQCDAIEAGLSRTRGEAQAATASRVKAFVKTAGGAAKKPAIFTARVIGAPIAGAAFLTAGACAAATVAAACPGAIVGASFGILYGVCSDSSTARCMAGGAKFGASVTGFLPFVLSLVLLQAGSAPYGFNGAALASDLFHSLAYATVECIVHTVHAFEET